MVLGVDEETAHGYAAIHDFLRRHGTPVFPNDLWIAASASQHGLTVITLDGDFDRIPQVLTSGRNLLWIGSGLETRLPVGVREAR